jgi:hypothetical protein
MFAHRFGQPLFGDRKHGRFQTFPDALSVDPEPREIGSDTAVNNQRVSVAAG